MILNGFAASSIALGAQRIRAGGLLGLPTETVYGLAADAENDAAVAQVFQAKGRPADHPLIVHVRDAGCVGHFAAQVPDFAGRLMQAFWPGPLTLILPRRPGVASAAAGGQDTIGLRCPSHPVAQALLQALLDTENGGQIPTHSERAKPQEKELASQPHGVWGIAAPSANQFGRVSPTTAAHVQGEFGPDLLILDGGACTVGIESTIIDCTRGQPVLLRPGAITREQVQAACGLKVLLKDELATHAAPAPKASGTLESHYAPKATVRLMDAAALQAALARWVADEAASGTAANMAVATQAQAPALPAIAIYARSLTPGRSPRLLSQRMPADAAAAARELFAVLRDLDAQGVQQIWIEAPPAGAEWDGVRDRLQRAAAR